MEGVNTLVGPMPTVNPSPTDAQAAPDRRGRGFSAMLPGRGNVVTDGSEWIVAVFVLGALSFLILLRAGGFQSIIAAR